MIEDALLNMTGMCKAFPGVQALQGVDFSVSRGEVHALMGENGAGKSTLIKVLTGVYRKDAGEIFFDDKPFSPASAAQAQHAGISTIYQELNLIPYLSVAENIFIGREPKKYGFIEWKTIETCAKAIFSRMGIEGVLINRPLEEHSVAVQQMVAIARALDINAKLLVLDEPTSSLDDREVEELFTVMRRLRNEGLGIVFVTHFLDQAYAVCDKITVLRDGFLVGEYLAEELPKAELIGRMIGRDADEISEQPEKETIDDDTEAEPFVEVEGLERAGSVGAFDMRIDRGRIVGLAGLLGSGRTEAARLLFGIDRPGKGRILLGGSEVSIHSPRAAIRNGFAFTPEDRKVAGIIPDLSVRENIILALQANRGILHAMSRSRQQEVTDEFIEALSIRTPSSEQPVKYLSGGNQQKVLLARWLAMHPQLLILDEPTRGIDVGAKAEIEDLMASLCKEGLAIVFISSELEEVVRDSHRVVVFRDRKQIGQLSGSEIGLQSIIDMIAERGDE